MRESEREREATQEGACTFRHVYSDVCARACMFVPVPAPVPVPMPVTRVCAFACYTVLSLFLCICLYRTGRTLREGCGVGSFWNFPNIKTASTAMPMPLPPNPSQIPTAQSHTPLKILSNTCMHTHKHPQPLPPSHTYTYAYAQPHTHAQQP